MIFNLRNLYILIIYILTDIHYFLLRINLYQSLAQSSLNFSTYPLDSHLEMALVGKDFDVFNQTALAAAHRILNFVVVADWDTCQADSGLQSCLILSCLNYSRVIGLQIFQLLLSLKYRYLIQLKYRSVLYRMKFLGQVI